MSPPTAGVQSSNNTLPYGMRLYSPMGHHWMMRVTLTLKT